jgi:hypothetical protein
LRSKIGEEKFKTVVKLFSDTEFPFDEIDSGPTQAKILEIIGEENADCIKIIKFLYANNSPTAISTF